MKREFVTLTVPKTRRHAIPHWATGEVPGSSGKIMRGKCGQELLLWLLLEGTGEKKQV